MQISLCNKLSVSTNSTVYNHSVPNDFDDDAARWVWLRIRALTAAPDVVAAEHAFMREIGLTAGPVRALRALLEHGAQPMRTLAEHLGCDKSYVTSLVKPLVAGDLATLDPDPSDGRVKTVTLTEKGMSVAQRAESVYATPPHELTALPSEALQQLARLLR